VSGLLAKAHFAALLSDSCINPAGPWGLLLRTAGMSLHRLVRAATTENAPPGEVGRFWGYYREERYVSLYMWIGGRWVSPVCAAGANVGNIGAITARDST